MRSTTKAAFTWRGLRGGAPATPIVSAKLERCFVERINYNSSFRVHRHQNQGTMPTDAHARFGRTPRLVHGEDMNPAGAFVVDPDTQHLYAAYGRGNIPQLERQKLMTGITDD